MSKREKDPNEKSKEKPEAKEKDKKASSIEQQLKEAVLKAEENWEKLLRKEAEFQNFVPYLEVIVLKKGLLFIVWLIFALMVGGILKAIGLVKEKVISKWQGVLIVIGLLLLINPDIELISSVGSALMCIAYIPWGIKEFKRKTI